MRAPLTVAVAQPRCISKDVQANGREHAELIRRAAARVVVFPELSLTGYELDAAAVSLDEAGVVMIVETCARTETLPSSELLSPAKVAAVTSRSSRSTLLARRSSTGKNYLGGDEPACFVPGDGPVALDVDGWRIGLGICKDTGVEQHIADTASLNVDLYAAGLVHFPEELEMQEERAVRIAVACSAPVAFASFAGPTGGGFDKTAGVSSIWAADGTPISRAGREPGDITRATLKRSPSADPQGSHRASFS
jgi:predicted amidohydrolase